MRIEVNVESGSLKMLCVLGLCKSSQEVRADGLYTFPVSLVSMGYNESKYRITGEVGLKRLDVPTVRSQ
jgi:hypothetical protein